MKLMRVLGILFVGLFVASTQAFATAALSFQVDGGGVIVCQDGDACDLNGGAGVVTVSADLGSGFSINVTTGITKPVFPTVGGSEIMDLNSVNVQTTGGTHDLVIQFSEVGFSSLLGFSSLFGGTLTFPAGSTVTANSYWDAANVRFAATTPICQIGPFGPGAFSGSCLGAGTGDSLYSLTERISLHTTGAGSFSGDFALNQVPEPATMLLIGSGSLMLGLRRRRKASKVA